MKNQRGLTLISVVIILALIAYFALLAMALLPMHQEYYGVVQIMKSMETELKGNKLTKQQVEKMFEKRLNVSYVSSVKIDNLQILRGQNTSYITKLVLDYEVREPFMFHIDLIGRFHSEIDVES